MVLSEVEFEKGQSLGVTPNQLHKGHKGYITQRLKVISGVWFQGGMHVTSVCAIYGF